MHRAALKVGVGGLGCVIGRIRRYVRGWGWGSRWVGQCHHVEVGATAGSGVGFGGGFGFRVMNADWVAFWSWSMDAWFGMYVWVGDVE